MGNKVFYAHSLKLSDSNDNCSVIFSNIFMNVIVPS
ncbi:hypothetical protein SAMN05444143_11381 [Flavobacterium succinicans]|uniref:Uncharacterized protein n=1 Tax=Flavobacterium succinicans TaxID=29536 RepID=A0A1I4Z4J0_9FLAO|nr:hypothetical protein SAMN05444143_11381 [Flavobacterium succinicans]